MMEGYYESARVSTYEVIEQEKITREFTGVLDHKGEMIYRPVKTYPLGFNLKRS